MTRKDFRIEAITREAEHEWFVSLVPGWQMDGAHCFGEDSRRDITATMRRVLPCECDECQVEMTIDNINEHLRRHIH
jgi:hypothetical protein